jgi:DNA-binding CsgD family transcriptional regulator
LRVQEPEECGTPRVPVKIEASDLFGAALDAVKSCVGLVDATGALVLCNRAMASALLAGGAKPKGGTLLPQPSWEQYVGAASITVQDLIEDGQSAAHGIVVCDPPERSSEPPILRPRLNELPHVVHVILTEARTGSSQLEYTPRGQPLRPPILSDREWEIAQGLMAYQRLSQVAGALGISIHTARTHLKSAFRKMQVRSQSELLQVLLGTCGREQRS